MEMLEKSQLIVKKLMKHLGSIILRILKKDVYIKIGSRWLFQCLSQLAK